MLKYLINAIPTLRGMNLGLVSTLVPVKTLVRPSGACTRVWTGTRVDTKPRSPLLVGIVYEPPSIVQSLLGSLHSHLIRDLQFCVDLTNAHSHFFFFFIVCFTRYLVFRIGVLPHRPGVVYYHLLLRRETRIPGVAPFSFRIGIWDLFVHRGQKSYTPTAFGKLWATPGVRCMKHASS